MLLHINESKARVIKIDQKNLLLTYNTAVLSQMLYYQVSSTNI